MMKTVGIFEAKSRLSELVKDVEEGETIVITRHGSPVARLVPAPTDEERLKRLIDEWFDFRKREGISPGPYTVNELIDEGQM